MPRLRIALTAAVLLAAASSVRAEWNPALAARYLDARQQAWFDWKTAQSSDGPCVSCHTGMTYLLARPVLRRALHETEPTTFETGLLTPRPHEVAWLRGHQDPATGAWPAVSMNKRYPDGSMPSLFMQGAATALASVALVEADATRR